MGSNAPPPGNYTDTAQQQAAASQQNVNVQTEANRPDVQTQFGSTHWEKGPNGQWTLTTGFSPQFQGLAGDLTGQANANMAAPFDLSQFGKLDDGSAARDQAIKSAYGQSVSRLNPQWNQRDEQLNAQLANQGLDPNSQASRVAKLQQSQERNDAYGSAMNGAIQQGTAAQQATFSQNLMARQQAIAEALRKRGMPMEELQQLQGLASGSNPNFNTAGLGQTPELLAAQMGQDNYNLSKQQLDQKMWADIIGGVTSLGGSVARAAIK